jgi:2'-hydroxyisoflavone reductase
MLAGMTSGALDLLVLGGTSWLGGAVARTAVTRGHRVTCLARGESGDAPDGVSWVRADRADEEVYADVSGRDWDGVVEVSWQPDFVRGALTALAGRIRHWVYVSSCSVYADDATPGTDEQAERLAPHQGGGPVDYDVYGQAKVTCEDAFRSALSEDEFLLARAGLIGGDGDRSDRLGYWPARVARARDGERVLVPPRSSPVQVVDVEDLATWLVDAVEERTAGAYNAVGDPSTVGEVLDACVAAAQRAPRFVEASGQWLAGQEVAPWMGPESLPLWLPLPEYAGFATRRNDAALQHGLRLRPLEQTVTATLLWEREQGLERERRAGLSPLREEELLARLDG